MVRISERMGRRPAGSAAYFDPMDGSAYRQAREESNAEVPHTRVAFTTANHEGEATPANVAPVTRGSRTPSRERI